MSKLLSKPFKAFTLYALLILICSIPAYYYVVESIWMEELDEHNLSIKHRVQDGLKKRSPDAKEIDYLKELWNVIQPGTSLELSNLKSIRADSAYTETHGKWQSQENEEDRYRCLSTYLSLNNQIYHLKIETNVEEVDETLLSIALVTILFFTLMIVGFVVLNRKISKKIWKPFNKTLQKLKEFDLSKHQHIEFDETDIEEFSQLNKSIEKLIQKNSSIYNQQKTFIENASHELQTPLAVLKSKLELLLQNEKFTEDQLFLIDSIHKPLGRVSRINKNLLLLAKIENNQFQEIETVDLSEIVKDSIDILEDLLKSKKIRIQLSTDKKVVLECNRTLLEILIHNLCLNAITHSISGSFINISISNNQFFIQNPGDKELSQATMFNRFETTGNHETSSGLGLSIVNEICKRYSWEINYYFHTNDHQFVISF